MVSDENPDVFLFQFVDYTLDILNRNRVHAGKWFVEHDKFRIDSKAAGYLGAASFATRQLIAEVFPHFLKSELRNQSFKLLSLLFLSHPGHLQDSPDIIFHAEFSEHRSLLRQITYAELSTLIDRESGDIPIVKEDLSGV